MLPHGTNDPFCHRLTRHRGTADSLDARVAGIDARDLLDRHAPVDAAKRRVVADIAHVGLVVVAGKHRHAADFSRRIEADQRIGRALIADHAVSRRARPQRPAQRDRVGRQHADHGRIARIGLDPHGVWIDPLQVRERGRLLEPARRHRATEPTHEGLLNRQARERGTCHRMGLIRLQAGQFFERFSPERLPEGGVAFHRMHMVPRVAAGKHLHTSHAEVAIADDQQVGRPRKADRGIARRRCAEHRADTLARCVEEVAAARHGIRRSADRCHLGQMPLHPRNRQAGQISSRLPTDISHMLRMHEPCDRRHDRHAGRVRDPWHGPRRNILNTEPRIHGCSVISRPEPAAGHRRGSQSAPTGSRGGPCRAASKARPSRPSASHTLRADSCRA